MRAVLLLLCISSLVFDTSCAALEERRAHKAARRERAALGVTTPPERAGTADDDRLAELARVPAAANPADVAVHVIRAGTAPVEQDRLAAMLHRGAAVPAAYVAPRGKTAALTVVVEHDGLLTPLMPAATDVDIDGKRAARVTDLEATHTTRIAAGRRHVKLTTHIVALIPSTTTSYGSQGTVRFDAAGTPSFGSQLMPGSSTRLHESHRTCSDGIDLRAKTGRSYTVRYVLRTLTTCHVTCIEKDADGERDCP